MIFAYVVILACGLLALAYGLVTSREVLAADGDAVTLDVSGSDPLRIPYDAIVRANVIETV